MARRLLLVPAMPSLRSTLLCFLVLSCGVSAIARAATPGSALSQAERPMRMSRRLAVSLSPDLFILTPDEFGGDAVLLPSLRLTGNLTSRFALTASYGGFPNFITQFDVGVNVALLETAFTPYVAVSGGALRHAADDIPARTDPFVIGLVGVSYVTSWGLDLAAEGGGGYQRNSNGSDDQNDLVLRFGLRAGYRFGSW